MGMFGSFFGRPKRGQGAYDPTMMNQRPMVRPMAPQMQPMASPRSQGPVGAGNNNVPGGMNVASALTSLGNVLGQGQEEEEDEGSPFSLSARSMIGRY